MATEESSVIAAVCNGARQCRNAGGKSTSKDENCMIGQIQITGLASPITARATLFENEIKSKPEEKSARVEFAEQLLKQMRR